MATRKTTTRGRGSVDALPFLEKLRGEPLTLGKLLESIRACDELSQAATARKLGVPRQHLCDIEKGRRPVSPGRAAEFARILGYSEAQFVAMALQDQLRGAGLKMRVKIEAA